MRMPHVRSERAAAGGDRQGEVGSGTLVAHEQTARLHGLGAQRPRGHQLPEGSHRQPVRALYANLPDLPRVRITLYNCNAPNQ